MGIHCITFEVKYNWFCMYVYLGDDCEKLKPADFQYEKCVWNCYISIRGSFMGIRLKFFES